jgi:hypothetical protein
VTRPAAGHLLYRSSATIDTPEGRLAIASALCTASAATAAATTAAAAAAAWSDSRDDHDAASAEDTPCWLEETEALAAMQPSSHPHQCTNEFTRGHHHQGASHETHGLRLGGQQRQILRYRKLMQCLFERYWPSAGLREWVHTCTPSIQQQQLSPLYGCPDQLSYDCADGKRERDSDKAVAAKDDIDDDHGAASYVHFSKSHHCNETDSKSCIISRPGVNGRRVAAQGVQHRMYVQHAEGELRVALNLLHV